MHTIEFKKERGRKDTFLLKKNLFHIFSKNFLKIVFPKFSKYFIQKIDLTVVLNINLAVEHHFQIFSMVGFTNNC